VQHGLIAGKAELVLAQADANQDGGRHVDAPNRLAAGEDKVVVPATRRRLSTAGTIEDETNPLPNKKSPDRKNFDREENASPRR
jgi:hypothetical protein